jgi:hypothetical protein
MLSVTKDEILDKVQQQLDQGQKVIDAFSLVGQEVDKSASSIQTLWYQSDRAKARHARKLKTAQEREEIAVDMFNELEAEDVDLTASEGRSMMESVTDHPWPQSQFNNWLSRHALIKLRPTTKEEDMRMHCDLVERDLALTPLTDQNALLCHEICLELHGRDELLIGKDGGQQNVLMGTDSDRCSLMTFVLASGIVAFSVLAVKTAENESEGFFEPTCEDERHPTIPPAYKMAHMYRTATGKITKRHFAKIMARFAEDWLVQFGLQAYVFSSRTPSPVTTQCAKEVLIKGIHLCLMPVDTSHFMEPLEKSFGTLYEKDPFPNIALGPASHKEFVSKLMLAERQAFTPDVIKEAFKRTGLCPWNRDILMGVAEDKDLQPPTKKQCQEEIKDEELTESLERRTCPVDDCGAKHYSGGGWQVCATCDHQFCPKHLEAFEQHRIGCEMKRQCPVDDCGAKHYSGANWVTCGKCKQQYCPKHHTAFELHAKSC